MLRNKRTLILIGSVRYLKAKELVFTKFGNPVKVLQIRESEIPIIGAQDVLVRMLFAPVNPSDINTIQGQYPVPLSLPCVAGNEGVGIVEEVGAYVRQIRPGHKVVITAPAQGTWRDIAVFDQSALKIVPDFIGSVEAATLTVNPCTAFRMLTDFQPLRQYSMVVIQNGANSACGQYVIQICKAWGIRTINIVRPRRKINDLKRHLKSLGATHVLTEDEVKTTNIFKEGIIDPPSLALNCVGGKSSLQMLKHLQPSTCMVTYGGMSKQPVIIPNSAFIFKNITFYGFWMTAWNKMAPKCAKDEMLSELISLMSEKQIVAPVHKKVKLNKFKVALRNSINVKGFQGCKYILDMS